MARPHPARNSVDTRQRFVTRLAGNTAVAMVLIGASLGAGMCGYHFIERIAWIDAFENAAMILSGMRPVTP
jgi:hypothetical protein